MATECSTEPVRFQAPGRREMVAAFDGGTISSDAGVLLLQQADRASGLIDRFAECFEDHRAPDRVEHSVRDLVAQRVLGLALGYEDLNDHDDLRRDPLLALVVGKVDLEGEGRRHQRDAGRPLAGKSTLNRLELGDPASAASDRYKRITADPEAISRLLVETFLDAHPEPPGEIVLDFDATDDPLHGRQEGRFFHGFYGCYCYLPLYVFCGEFVLCARLRESGQDAAAGAVEELARIVSQIRQRWPEVRITLRADSGFCREEIMAWCEARGVDYVLGLAKNERLKARIADAQERVRTRHEQSGAAEREFVEFQYATLSSWSRTRRVIAKVEHLAKGANPRFVVTSLSPETLDARALYEEIYSARGEAENRIKEQQLALFADRTSAGEFRANQLRLWFSSVAYALLQTLRRIGLAGTRLARAQCGTIRLKLLKIGARVKVTARKVWVSMAGGCPDSDLFAHVHRALRQCRPMRC